MLKNFSRRRRMSQLQPDEKLRLQEWSWLRLQVGFAVIIGLAAAYTTMSPLLHGASAVHGASAAFDPAQTAADPEVVLNDQGLIRDWHVVTGGYLYWYENCVRGGTRAFLKRRAVNGDVITTLVDIDDANQCKTLIGPGVDNSGFYYYNYADGTIEAKHSYLPDDPPTVLATIGQRGGSSYNSYEISDMFINRGYVYWIEVDWQGEFDPNIIRIRRVGKSGGTPVTLLTYEGGYAGYGMGFTYEHIWWTDSDGLHRMGDDSCWYYAGTSCQPTLVHAAFLSEGRLATHQYAQGGGSLVGTYLYWWDRDPPAGYNAQIFATHCVISYTNCETQSFYTAPDFTKISDLDIVRSDDLVPEVRVYWTESSGALRSMNTDGTNVALLFVGAGALGVDRTSVYFTSCSGQCIMRLPNDAQPIVRDISFEAWEVTQAIQSADNDVPLVAGKPTFVRVYAGLDSNSASSGVEARLYGSRDGVALPWSPLFPLNGPVAVHDPDPLLLRGDIDSGWLFELPASWTRATETSIPREDSDLTLKIVLDPRGLTGDSTPGDLVNEETFTFTAKAPTCVHLRPVWTNGPSYQPPTGYSIDLTAELAEAAHPTPRFLRTSDFSRLSAIEWCWKWYGYGPYCSGPYDLNGSLLHFWTQAESLLTKMVLLDTLHDNPEICTETGARTLYGGVLSIDDPWDSGGMALRGFDSFLTKVLPVSDWTAYETGLTDYTAMTFVHEVGHNYDRKHVDCGEPDEPGYYPYNNPCTLDDGSLALPDTHVGFNSMFMSVLHPQDNTDYMSYSGPRWVSDHTWKGIFDNTGPPEPLPIFPQASGSRVAADSFVLVSGLVESSAPAGAIESVWNYPTADASAGLIGKWENATADLWTGETYHLRLLDSSGTVLTDRAIVPTELSDGGTAAAFPFQSVFPAPDDPVSTVHLMMDETVLASFDTSDSQPSVTIVNPRGGETVEGDVTLEWTATDLDDPPWLLYIIQYSPDQGENWHSLIVNHAGPGRGISESLPLDLRGQPGSDGQNAFLRVLASDGYNTGLGTSQPFGVAPRAPDVFIAAPGEGEWYAAGEPIVLRGDALDPEDIVLEDDALTWSLGGSVIDTGANSIVGLAPGEHSLTLAAIDSDGLRGSATVTFTVGALDIPLAPTLVLDGQCSDMGYNTTALPLSPYADASRAFAFTARTDDHLWVCLQGLQGAGDFAGLQVDVDNSQETAVQLGDLGFFVKLDGTPRAMEGDGSNWALIQPTGMEAHISGDSSGWSAELRIDASTLGGWNRRVAMGIGHYGSGVNAVWPHSAALEQPQSWAQTNLVLGETLELRAMSPVSTTMLSSVLALTVTGANFQRDSVVVWNTFPLSTTYVSSSTLTATGPGFLTNLAGEHTVHVAPSSAHELGSNPLPFMVVYPQPSITNLNPSSARWNDNGFTLIVDGSGFDVDSTVLWNGEPRPTLFISSSRLNATISAEDLAAARSVSIRVANPVPNAGSSEVATFKVRRTYEQYLPFVRSDD